MLRTGLLERQTSTEDSTHTCEQDQRVANITMRMHNANIEVKHLQGIGWVLRIRQDKSYRRGKGLCSWR